MCGEMYVFVIILCKVLLISGQEEDIRTTVKTIMIETTTEAVTIITDIPQSDVELALNQDYGTYTTQSYRYINSQYDKLLDVDKCFDDYTKCLITQGVTHPVCVVNDPDERPDGFSTYNSYCDAYFDNCQRKMRFWRILDVGKCNFGKGNYFNIFQSRKYFDEMPFFLKKLIKITFK